MAFSIHEILTEIISYLLYRTIYYTKDNFMF